MDPLLESIRRPFAERIGASGPWYSFAFHAPRTTVAVAFALVAPLVFLALLPFFPQVAEGQRVREVFARYISGLITAATIAVSFGTLALRRGIKGIGEIREHVAQDRAFRDDVRKVTKRERLPLDLGNFLAALHEDLTDACARTREGATQAEREHDVDGVRLDEFLAVLEAQLRGTAERFAAERVHPHALLETSLDFDQDTSAHLARRFGRASGIGDETRERLHQLAEMLESAGVGGLYVKTLDMQRSLSSMSHWIALTSFAAVITATFIALGYEPTTAGLAVLALALVVVTLPLGVFVSFMLRFVFVSQHSLSIGSFMLGPENRMLGRERPRRGEGGTRGG